jgi:glycosyltransferase involved in cell wall biosynthesis
MRQESGGVVRALLDMCLAMAERGHHVTLLTFDRGDVPEDWDGRDGRPALVAMPRAGLPTRPVGRAAARAATQRIAEADIVHFHGIWDPACRQFAAICRRRGVPYVVSIHGMLDDWCMAQKSAKKKLYLATGGRRFIENAAAVHCTAEAELEQSRKWYPRGRGVVVPLLFDLDSFREPPGDGPARRAFPQAFERPTMVLFLSRIHEKKGLEILIEAGATLRKRSIDTTIAIAGTGEEHYVARLRALAHRSGMGDRVHFLGFASGVEKVSLYQAADVFALPTSQENWGFVSLEALACGTPVLTTRGVDIWPELEASGGARIVDATPEAFAEAIADQLADDALRRSMGERGRAWVLEELTSDRVIDRYEEMYRLGVDDSR